MCEVEYFDSHAHLMGEEYNEDRNEVVEDCLKANVKRVMIITLDLEEGEKALAFQKTNPSMFQVSNGIFPCDIDETTPSKWDDFVKLVRHDEITAIGEIGLDYYWVKDEGQRELQKEWFIKQLELAKELNKPVLIHSRDAIQDTYDILKQHRVKGIIHCFPGSLEMAKEFTKLGYYIALGGPVTFKNARHAVDVVKGIDLNYLLTETDAPFMAPVPVRGTRNVPSNIPYIVEKMAEIREMPVEEMAKILNDNYTRFLAGNE